MMSLEPCDFLLRPLNKITPPDNLKDEIDKEEKEVKAQLDKINKNDLMRMGQYVEGDEEIETEEDFDIDDVYTNDKIKAEVWRNYIEYLKNLSFYLKKGSELDMVGELKGILLRKCFRAALKFTNSKASNGQKMKNLWGRMGYNAPLEATAKYRRSDYGNDEFDKLWKRFDVSEESDRSIFTNINRLKIVSTAINDLLVIQNLKYYDHIESFFPLHNEFDLKGISRVREGMIHGDGNELSKLDKIENAKKEKLSRLQEEFKGLFKDAYEFVKEEQYNLREEWTHGWKLWKIFDPPTTAIRNYFGEKIAFYFDFLGLYSRYLLFAPLIGIALFITFAIFDSDHDVNKVMYVVYAAITIFWTTIFLEHLKRRTNAKAIEWGQSELQEDEIIRPQFHGKSRRSPINDDLQEPWHPTCGRWIKLIITTLCLSILIAISLAATGALFYLRWYLADDTWKGKSEIQWAAYLTAMGQGAVILILDMAFKPLIYALTKFENHKTKIKFEYSYVIKMFIFRFVNNYSSFIYIAFAKQWHKDGGCIDTENNVQHDKQDCMWELKYQLIFIFIIYIFQNVIEVAKPLMKLRCSDGDYLKKVAMTQRYSDETILKEKIETEWKRESYDEGEINGTVEEYSELMVQFGFVSLFSMAFPLVPLLAFLNNIIEMKIDKHKVMYMTRRPIPVVAKSNGIFTYLFAIISFLAIFTNLGIMSFTGKVFGEDDMYNSFLWFTIGALFFKFFLSETIPDYSESTFNVMERHKVIVKKALATLNKGDDNNAFKVERINLDVLFTEKGGERKSKTIDTKSDLVKKSEESDEEEKKEKTPTKKETPPPKKTSTASKKSDKTPEKKEEEKKEEVKKPAGKKAGAEKKVPKGKKGKK